MYVCVYIYIYIYMCIYVCPEVGGGGRIPGLPVEG